MKHITFSSSLFLKALFSGVFCLLLSQAVVAQHRYPNNFRTAVGFAYIVEGDNSGAIFSQQYTREIAPRINFSASAEYLSSSRFDQQKEIFTSRKAFVMFDASLFYDLLETETYAIRIGGGPAFRRRSEVDLVRGTTGGVTTPGNTAGESFIHIRERDFGGKIMAETDFFNDTRLFFGGRATGYIYNAGSSIFALSVSMGYSF